MKTYCSDDFKDSAVFQSEYRKMLEEDNRKLEAKIKELEESNQSLRDQAKVLREGLEEMESSPDCMYEIIEELRAKAEQIEKEGE